MGKVEWIKITTDMFDSSKIKYLRILPDGNNVVLIWVMLLTIAGKCNSNGMVILAENIPYTPEMLSNELGFEINTVKMALAALEQLNMISKYNDCYSISNWKEYQNADKLQEMREKDRLRKQEERKKAKELPDKKEDEKSCPRTVHGQSTDSSYSYSYSISNNNITNISFILSNTNKYNKYSKYIDYINDNKDLLNILKEFMEYKDGRKPNNNNHYEEKGLLSLIKKFAEESIEYGTESVIYVVEDAMANNYQGIVWDKIVKFNKNGIRKEVNSGNSRNNGNTGNDDERICGYTIAELKEQGFTDADIEAERRRIQMS